MGQNQSIKNQNQSIKSQNNNIQLSCTDDLMCKNIDSKRSIPGQPPVLVCPDAKCQAGTCVCGSSCVKDPYTGICCSRLEKIESKTGNDTTTFCIEDTVKPVVDKYVENFKYL